ncbi:GNAT family N-acetyltransferase [Coralloluteibacterium thermophilus]|uniref:GNAT family N-acetyltransferase n=1 Tax=Coralloluteibacterium thermophilum TaxID=2707049 RepID=A0ABV9NG38_9GAMM
MQTEVPIEIRCDAGAQRLEAHVGDARAYVAFEEEDGVVTFTHTVVPETLRGRGIGTRLVREALDCARREGLAVVPRCAMFAAYMRRHEETQDLLSASGRTLLGLGPAA